MRAYSHHSGSSVQTHLNSWKVSKSSCSKLTFHANIRFISRVVVKCSIMIYASASMTILLNVLTTTSFLKFFMCYRYQTTSYAGKYFKVPWFYWFPCWGVLGWLIIMRPTGGFWYRGMNQLWKPSWRLKLQFHECNRIKVPNTSFFLYSRLHTLISNGQKYKNMMYL